MSKKPKLKDVESIPEPKPSQSLKVSFNDLKHINPLTDTQEDFFRLYKSGIQAMMLQGSAGTGKTYIALYAALNDVLSKSKRQNKIVIVRSAVPSREIGYLPGDEKEKAEVYMIPYVDICSDLIPRMASSAFQRLNEQKYVEFMLTSYVRGLTLENAIVIVDECQNLAASELHTIMTRIGENSRIIFCGDFRQCDLLKRHDKSGLEHFLKVVSHMKSFRTIEFGIEDVVRSGLVKEYLLAVMHLEDLGIE